MATAPIHPNAHHPAAHAHKAAAPGSAGGSPAGSPGGSASASFAALIDRRQTAPAQPAPSRPPGATVAAASTPRACPAPAVLGRFVGRSTGTGQCVALVQAADPSLGPTARWRRGEPVQGNASLPPGTPIATFAHSGRYANATDGSSHAAIYLGQTAHGIQVLDQWAGKAAAIRTIPWSHPGAVAANTGSAFHVVYIDQAQSA